MNSIKTNFLVEFISNFPSLARTGKLICGKSILETPCCMLTTKGGSVPHLSKEVLGYLLKDKMMHHLLQISLTSTIHMEEALNSTKAGIGSFVGYKELPTFVTLHDPCELTQSGFTEKDTVPVFTRRGKEVLTAEKYMRLMIAMQPDIYQVICDADTNNESSKKRIQKSIDRSEKLLKNCLEIHMNSIDLSKSMILVPIVGGYDKDARTSSIKACKEFQSNVGGYVLDGFHNNGSSTINVNTDNLKEIVLHCLKEINDDKIKFMQGALDPLTILELINLGIDVFDTSYSYLATKNNKALCFDYALSEDKNATVFCIDLSEDKYKEEFIPFRQNCNCLACEKHSRAYVHHLIKTRELLGSILLMIHNLHHYLRFFDSIRRAIRKNEFEKLTVLIRSQMLDQDMECILKENVIDKKKV